MHILVTCEHGGNAVPAKYRHLFAGQHEALESHRGYDAGALALARDIAVAFDTELLYSTQTRLLIDFNRSHKNRRSIFSEFSRQLPISEKQSLFERDYVPYRQGVEARIRHAISHQAAVLHLSVHSFTPILHGKTRTADIGLLYDPARSDEKAFCRQWRSALERTGSPYRVKMNYPYLGTSDGLTTHLRRIFDNKHYMGIELEVNQKHLTKGGRFRQALHRHLIESLQLAVSETARSRAAS